MRWSTTLFVIVFGAGSLLFLSGGCKESTTPSEEESHAQEESGEEVPGFGEEASSNLPSVCDADLLQKAAIGEKSLLDACLLPATLRPLVKSLETGDDEEDQELFSQRMIQASDSIERACPGYQSVFQSLETRASGERKEALIGGCHLDRLGVGTQDELMAYDGMRVLVGSAVYQWMQDHRVAGAKDAIRGWMSR
jgi:hypothetical protein